MRETGTVSRHLLMLSLSGKWSLVFFFQAEDGIRDLTVTGVQTCALPISLERVAEVYAQAERMPNIVIRGVQMHIGSQITDAAPFAEAIAKVTPLIRKLKEDRKSTRLNSSHSQISYAVFCLKTKKKCDTDG